MCTPVILTPRRMWDGGSEQHLLTPLPGAPGSPRAPGANSQKLYVDVLCFCFSTIALPVFGKKLYVAMFYYDFGAITFPISGKNLYVAVFMFCPLVRVCCWFRLGGPALSRWRPPSGATF